MAEDSFSRYLLLPELRLLETRALGKDGLGGTELVAEKVSPMEVCPRCATPSTSVYDRRWGPRGGARSRRWEDRGGGGLEAEPRRRGQPILLVRRRRLWCSGCKKPFTE